MCENPEGKEKELMAKVLKELQQYADFLNEKNKDSLQKSRFDYFYINLKRKQIQRRTHPIDGEYY